jgi:hypothetical protein|uniref:Uncharacterized protein n=1 Tax=Zea mays TaxID=4577 RepID=A0A804NRZ4_MAIZE
MTTRSNAGRARRRGHGDCDIAAVHDIELHSDISSNTHEAPTLRGCGGNSVARSCAAGRGSRAATSCHEEGIAEPLLGEMPVCYGGRLVSRGDVGRRETGGVGMELGDVLEVGGCARERSNKRPRPWASSCHEEEGALGGLEAPAPCCSRSPGGAGRAPLTSAGRGARSREPAATTAGMWSRGRARVLEPAQGRGRRRHGWTGRELPACFVGKKKWLAAVGSVGVGMQKWLRARERAPIYRHMVGLGFFLVGLLG